MAISGVNTRLRVNGESTPMTGEAMTQSGGSRTYFTASAARNLWDPNATLVVLDNGVIVAPANYTANYLLGKVTFADTYTVTGPVTVTGNYLPSLTLAQCRSAEATFMRELVETTVFGEDARNRVGTIKDCNFSLTQLDFGLSDLDPGAATRTFNGLLDGGAAFVVEFQPNNAVDDVFRAWVKLASNNASSAPDAVTEANYDLQGVTVGDFNNSWSFGDPTA